MIKAAGILLLTASDGRALFLRRSDTGEWAFPGGQIEAGETAEQAAERETREEIGAAPYSSPQLLMRRIKADVRPNASAPAEEVDFTTFVSKVESEFVPEINDEHTAWCWASVDDPPQPLHPGAAVALTRLTMDELGIARSMAAGDLTSPQRYGSFWLWSIRITGTGFAFRDSRNEYCHRPADIYLNDEFLARCAGLPVIFIHPAKKPKLDSKEFNDRVVGTVFVPFLKGTEVWAVCRIYDDDTVAVLRNKEFSTSPGVVFGRDSGNRTLKTESGATLLWEGKPALLDHIALVEAGVWDLGGEPSGIETVITKEPIGMTEEEQAAADKARKDADAKLDAIMDSLTKAHSRMDAMERDDKSRKDAEEKEREDRARKDAARGARLDAHRTGRFGARKDGESHQDWGKRHDADEAAMCDAMRQDGAEEAEAREDARRARHDAEERERQDGGEPFEKWAKEEKKEPEHKDDKARKDAEEKEQMEREDRARHDAQTGEIADLRRQLATMNARFVPTSAEERNALATAQSRADSIAGLFGKGRASQPVPGEASIDYRRRLAGEFKQHSARFKDKNLGSLDSDMLDMVEDQIYADATAAARSPDRAGLGVLIPIREQDEAGRTITRWTGDNMVWMQAFMSPGRVGKIIDPRNRNT